MTPPNDLDRIPIQTEALELADRFKQVLSATSLTPKQQQEIGSVLRAFLLEHSNLRLRLAELEREAEERDSQIESLRADLKHRDSQIAALQGEFQKIRDS